MNQPQEPQARAGVPQTEEIPPPGLPESPAMPTGANITKVANGFIIIVGCKTFVAKTWKEASDGLGEYWENPSKAEKKYTAK